MTHLAIPSTTFCAFKAINTFSAWPFILTDIRRTKGFGILIHFLCETSFLSQTLNRSSHFLTNLARKSLLKRETDLFASDLLVDVQINLL